jgi:hypothetical protein
LGLSGDIAGFAASFGFAVGAGIVLARSGPGDRSVFV